ncbi:MAG TPA: vWA domain-containing protein [Polyangia bacterium]|nr:vWA domain-containing protein [Polyangia bacterium]
MKPLASLLAVLILLLQGGANADESNPATPGASGAARLAVGMLVLWDTGAGLAALDGRDLGRFLGGLRPGDRAGFLAAGARPRLLQPLSEVVAEGAASAGYAIAAGLVPVAEESDPRAALEAALEHLAALRRPRERQVVVVVSDGAGADAGLEDIASRFVLREIIVHAVHVAGSRPGSAADRAALEGLAGSTGGRFIAVADGGSALSALHFAYDSSRLAAADLARTQVDVEGPRPDEDFSFLDEKRTIEQIAAAAGGRSSAREAPGFPPALAAALVASLVLLLAILGYAIFIGQRLSAVLRIHGDLDAILRDRSSPSFARLSQAMSRLQRSWNEAEKHVQALGLDLEDYGIESWEIEKRLLDNYASLADSLFLLIDHLELQAQAGQAADPAWFRSRLRQILDDEGIHEIAAGPGEEAATARYVRTGERPDPAPSGTVLELVRRGWVKRRGAIGDEDLVLRKAEVIVSAGPAPGRGGERQDG